MTHSGSNCVMLKTPVAHGTGRNTYEIFHTQDLCTACARWLASALHVSFIWSLSARYMISSVRAKFIWLPYQQAIHGLHHTAVDKLARLVYTLSQWYWYSGSHVGASHVLSPSLRSVWMVQLSEIWMSLALFWSTSCALGYFTVAEAMVFVFSLDTIHSIEMVFSRGLCVQWKHSVGMQKYIANFANLDPWSPRLLCCTECWAS